MSFPSRIFLTGFMAAGKSTVGPELAQRLAYAFVDMDHEIERDAGRSVRQIFVDEGEDGFRALERKVLERMTQRESVVVATGGGALVAADAMALARSAGVVVYLDAAEETILERVSESADRPLLQGDAAVRVRQLLAARRPHYEAADVRVEVGDKPPDVIADEIMRLLSA